MTIMKPSAMHPYPTPRGQHGLSLIELMISITIGLILLLGITTLIVQQSSTRDELEKSSRQIENGRYATELLHDEIQHAGYYGPLSPLSTTTYTATDPCTPLTPFPGALALGWQPAPMQVPVPIYGYAGAAAAPLACLTNYKPNTAVLVVRRVETTPLLTTAAVAGTTYLQVSGCNNEATTPFVMGTGGFILHDKACTATPPVMTLTQLRKYIVRIYYVGSCNVCGATPDNIPTLKVIENGGSITPLVEGIENMQLDYGVDADNDGYPDSYASATTLGAAAANWANVMAVRVHVLARNNEPTVGFSDIKTYTLGATVIGPFNEDPVAQRSPVCINAAGVAGTGSYPQRCNYKYHVFSELVRAINPSGRRAQQ